MTTLTFASNEAVLAFCNQIAAKHAAAPIDGVTGQGSTPEELVATPARDAKRGALMTAELAEHGLHARIDVVSTEDGKTLYEGAVTSPVDGTTLWFKNH